MSILLTDIEVAKAYYDAVKNDVRLSDKRRAIAKAQLKKVVEWGNKECRNEDHHRDKPWILNRYCPYCWQALLKEVEGG